MSANPNASTWKEKQEIERQGAEVKGIKQGVTQGGCSTTEGQAILKAR